MTNGFRAEYFGCRNYNLPSLKKEGHKKSEMKDLIMKKKAVIIFSGGLDSTTCIAIAQDQGFEAVGLTFNYSQRHSSEIDASKRVALQYGIEQRIFTLPINDFGGSALTDQDIAVPEFDGNCSTIPITYVPARNTIFLSIALSFAETIDAKDIFLGINAVDYSNYPDCRPDYLAAFQQVANLGTKAGVEGKGFTIHAPLLSLSKAEIIQKGTDLGVDYSMTVSCYQANERGEACGVCDSCIYRKKGFAEARVNDPTRYKNAFFY